MALLSQMFRTVAITGRTDTINAWFAGRQSGRWAEQTVRAAFPEVPAHGSGAASTDAPSQPADPAETLRELAELQRRGAITEAEAEALGARLGL